MPQDRKRFYMIEDPQGRRWETSRDRECTVVALLLHFPDQILQYTKTAHPWAESYEVVFFDDLPITRGGPVRSPEEQTNDLIETFSSKGHRGPVPDRWELIQVQPTNSRTHPQRSHS